MTIGEGKMNKDLIRRGEEFLKERFEHSDFMNTHPVDKEYRLQHSYRVANIGKMIAQKEGFDVTEMVLACLLHDIAYSGTFDDFEKDWLNHGRNGAKIARPFLEESGLPAERINEICYGIAIHVDLEADFEGDKTAFALTVRDADNIDRFDAYRIYEGLQYQKFNQMPYAEKLNNVVETLAELKNLREMEMGTATAKEMWQERVDYNISFYEKLKSQLENSTSIV